MGNAGSTKGQIWRCSRTFRYSDSPLKCPLSRIIQWSSNDQIIHHTYTYNAAKAQNGVRESFAKGLFFFSSEDGARLGIRNLINAHFFFLRRYLRLFVRVIKSWSESWLHGQECIIIFEPIDMEVMSASRFLMDCLGQLTRDASAKRTRCETWVWDP